MSYALLMKLGRPPLFDYLERSARVLLAGAGGGYDIFCGLPLYFALEAEGKQVFLANLSFSNLGGVSARRLAPAVATVNRLSEGSERYFPERHLAAWFETEGRDVSIYCFEKTGVVPLTEAYRAVIDEHSIDALVLIDGGTDSLMRGDEAGLGTPAEDMASIAAATNIDLDTKALVCLGFGVDTYHGVSHAQVLEATAELQRDGGFLGAFSLLPEMPEVKQYIDAVSYVRRLSPKRPSIVNASILSALEGAFGDVHSTDRTRGSELFINPLMSQYFAYRLDPLANRVRYLEKLRYTQTIAEVVAIIEAYRKNETIRNWRTIPL
ncbi:MAG: DUF1152 domain-containing protein [Myxococcota bacterium]